MTEPEYLISHTILTNEVENALESFYMYMEINDNAANSDLMLNYMNLSAFWPAISHALQTTFITTLGRIFDRDDRSLSIHYLIKETVKHPEYFSREALAQRKRAVIGAFEPEWLKSYLDDAWKPHANDLAQLHPALSTVTKKYKETFEPIRNKIFAHRDRLDRAAIQAILSKGLISDLEYIFYFLHDLLACLFELIHNGVKPQLGIRQYDYERRARSAARECLNLLLTAYNRNSDCP